MVGAGQSPAVHASGGAELKQVGVKNGTLCFADGTEVALWGVNFQTCLWWEYRRISKKGEFTPFNLDEYKAMVDQSFDEIQLMGCDLIRIHLCPGDFTDAEGNLVQNQWLDLLDHTLAECRKRKIYLHLAFLNEMGSTLKDSFVKQGKSSKWQWMAAPDLIKKCDNYMRQLVNRRNPCDEGRPYKQNPALIIAEMINEPTFPKEKPAGKDAELSEPGMAAYKAWLGRKAQPDTQDAWLAFRNETFLSAINRFCDFMQSEEVKAVPCWNLYWAKGPIHQLPGPYDAAAQSRIELVSFSTYPGQDQSKLVAGQKEPDLNEVNFLPYLEQSLRRADWQGWLQTPAFKGRRARIVYEYETWHNRSTYLYPAMAKYFRAQGAQAATMWTYTFGPLGPYMSPGASHNLSLTYTPRKAASFLVAHEVFKRFPRFGEYKTTGSDTDNFDYCALSLPRDLSAFSDDATFIHTGDVTREFIRIPASPQRIVGYGSSPFATYQGSGLYFLDRGSGAERNRWNLRILPHFEWLADKEDHGQSNGAVSRLDREKAMPMKLRLPGMKAGTKVWRREGNQFVEETSSFQGNALSFTPKPGQYVIE